MIIRTRLEYPGEPIKKLWGKQIENYWSLTLPVLEVLKCEPSFPWSFDPLRIQPGNLWGRTVRVAYYAGEANKADPDRDKARFFRHQGQEVILLLQFVGDGDSSSSKRQLLLSYNNSINPWSQKVAQDIRAEIATHGPMADQVRDYLNRSPQPQEARVQELLEDLMHPDRYSNKQRDDSVSRMFEGMQKPGSVRMTYPEPLAQLEELGLDAVPAIIKHLDDPRRLPKGRTLVMLDIHDHPHAWEGVYHTSASTISEVLQFALSQITLAGISGSQGDSGRAEKVTTAWRLWMVHSGMLAGIDSGKTPSQSVPPPPFVKEPGMKPAVFGNNGVL